MIQNSAIMNNQKQVWRLFKSDPICWVMVRFYEKVRFPLYAVLTFTYLFLIPLILRYFSGIMPDLRSIVFIRNFLLYGTLPVLGSWLGYRWLNSILCSVQELASQQVLKPQDSKDVEEALVKDCNRVTYIGLSFLFLGCIIYHYLTQAGPRFFDAFIPNIYILFVNSIWWYFIIKVVFVCLITFYNYGVLLVKKNEGEYILGISLYHPDTYYGLSSIGENCVNFLFVHIIVIGSYLILSVWFSGIFRLSSFFMICVIAVYVALPIYVFFWVFRNAYKRIKEIRYAELEKLWRRIEELSKHKDFNINEYRNLTILYDRAKDASLWPVGIRKAASLFSAYCLPAISWFIHQFTKLSG